MTPESRGDPSWVWLAAVVLAYLAGAVTGCGMTVARWAP